MRMHLLKSRQITILAHLLAWVVFAIAVFFYHPLFSGIDIPYQAWITQTVTLTLLVVAFYVNVSVLVPRFLLNNQLAYYFALIIALIAAILFINRGVENALEVGQEFSTNRQGQEAEFIKPPPRMKLGRHRPIDRSTTIISALVLGVGTGIAAIQKWQKDKQKREELREI